MEGVRIYLFALLACACLILGCFPRQAGPRLAHFATTAPAVGEPAPAFSLPSLDGGELALEELLDDRPVVIQLGSHSCPVYRFRRHWLRGLLEDYGERVRFLVIYSIEAHPEGSKSPHAEGEWNPWINKIAGIRIAQPETFEERFERARQSRIDLGLTDFESSLSFVVDRLDDAIWQTYGAASAPAFVLDRDGTVVSRQVWVDPKEIRRVLDRLLAADPEPAAARERAAAQSDERAPQ
ncbi:MAG: deiodinase-like protein [Acidobacteriota bacterium]